MPSITVQRAPVAEMGYGKRAEHGLGAWLPIGRLPRVRPLLRLESSLFSSLKGAPQRRMAFVGKRRCQAIGGISCLQEMERCGLCVDEKQGGTA